MEAKADKKTMMFIPTELKDTYLDSQFGTVPTLIMIVKGDDINCCIDRKCPCDCKDKIEHFKLRKKDLNEWLKTNPHFYRIS